MKLSKSGIKTARIKDVDPNYPAQDILLQSGQLSQYGSGIYAYNNVPLKVKQRIEEIIRTELEKKDCIEVELPTLQPRELWEESGRWERYTNEGTMLTVKARNGEFGLAPTAEEAVVDFARDQIASYKKLPVIYYQIGEKYRNELRNRGCLLRGKTFPMMDAYSFNKGEEDLQESYDTIRDAYLKIFEQLGLEAIPVAAESGAIGGDKSEEFMVLADIGEDTVLVDEEQKKGFNVEVLERPNYEEHLKGEYGIENIDALKKKKAIELGHIFQLGTKYSESMKADYVDEKSQKNPFYMGCYGIGVSRTLATIYEKSLIRDEKGNLGISLPVNLAPYLLHIISKGEEKGKRAESLYEVLKDYGIETILDDREEGSIGRKIRDCQILGTPYIGILGDRTKEDEIEVQVSATGEKRVIKTAKLVSALKKLENDRRTNPKARLEDYLGWNIEQEKEKVEAGKTDREDEEEMSL